ncbi:MAG: type I-E CRISPR-associated protein Cas6/Cse3/CasE [Hyphomicrobiaceae bacterium]
MPLYLTRARLRVEDTRIAALLPLLVKEQSGASAAHHRIWSLMSDGSDRSRDFLFRDAGDVTFVLSQRIPGSSPIWQHESRVIPAFEAGDVLNFTLRASPVIRRARDGRRSAKRDPILERLGQLALDDRRARRQEIAQEETSRWLTAMGESSGYRLGDVLVENHEQVKVRRRGAPVIQFSIVDVSGTLTVTNPTVFADRLGQGFGPAKAWGCGLMLCRRINR